MDRSLKGILGGGFIIEGKDEEQRNFHPLSTKNLIDDIENYPIQRVNTADYLSHGKAMRMRATSAHRNHH